MLLIITASMPQAIDWSKMVRLSPNVFLRHMGDESVVWCPRTGGCTVMCNAHQILSAVTHSWQGIDNIVHVVATKYGCQECDVRDGVIFIINELVAQQFVEQMSCETVPILPYKSEDCEGVSISPEERDAWMLLRDYYTRYNLPIELHIDLTDACNEKCIHCYLPKGGTHYLEKDVALKVLREFRDAQGMTVYVSGGECMLHKDFAEILRYAKSLNLNIIVMSNLTLCDEKMVALLREIDPQFVNVSLYAVTEAIHDSVTQVPGSCRKTKEAIDALQVAGVHVRIATPFMRENKGCVAELKEYAAKRHVRIVADAEIFGQLDHSCANQKHALSMNELSDIISAEKTLFWQGHLRPEKCMPEAKACDIGETRFNLNSDAKYYPCDGFHSAIIGDARHDTILEVWTGQALNKLRAHKNRDFGSCASCVDRAWCKVCPMRNFNETGDMFTHAPWRCKATRIYRRIFEEK